jgi:hypothetical protein
VGAPADNAGITPIARARLEAIGTRGEDVFLVSRRKPNGMYGFPNNFIEGCCRFPRRYDLALLAD